MSSFLLLVVHLSNFLLTTVVVATAYTISNTYNASKEFNVAVSMDLFTNNQYTQKHTTSITVNYNDYIYVGINEDNSNEHFRFVVTQCFATQASYSEGDVQDIFFDDKCSLDSTFSIESVEGENDKFNFAIQAFYFIDGAQSVYLNCRIKICTTDSSDTLCSQNCATSSNRWRRDVEKDTSVDNDVKNERQRRNVGQSDSVLVTSQLITLNDNRTCQDLTSACPQHSRCYNLHPVSCICDVGYAYSRPTKTCVKERLVKINGIYTALQWNHIYSNTLTLDFLKLARRYENLFYQLFHATGTTNEIHGIKLVNAQNDKGVTIFDVELIARESSSEMDIYKAFMTAINSNILRVTTVRRKLRLIENRFPTLSRQKRHVAATEALDVTQIIMIVIIVLLSILVIISAFVIFQVHGGRSFKLMNVSERKDAKASRRKITTYHNEGLQVQSEATY